MKRPQIGGGAQKRPASRPQNNVVVPISKARQQSKKPALKSLAPKTTSPKTKFPKTKFPKTKFPKTKSRKSIAPRRSALDSITRGVGSRLSEGLANAIDGRQRFATYSRNRKIVAYSLIGSFSALLLLVLACVFTPIIAVQKIVVTGLDRVNEKQVMKVLKNQIGLPLPQVNQQAIADSLKQFALIDSVAAIAQPPHTLQVAITERQPICIVNVGGVSYLYDAAGVRIDSARLSDKYPLISIVGDPKASKSFSQAIDVLLALPADLLGRVAEIDAKSKDDVTMRLRGYAGQRILWGDSSQSVLKSKVLGALIKNQKITDRVTFDVSSPTAPIVRYQ